ncbi:MAG TPA: ribonuclease HI family protein [Candidatus Woesebacteria bacterium]|nr:ribonuclease HI family protein [Candidatus Woesebacteria bacterium]
MKIKIYTDGGSRGNPGISGFGLVVIDEANQIVYQQSQSLGIKTNNEAEYAGALSAISWLVANQSRFTSAQFISDSQLMICQINGQYKVKAANLIPLYQQLISLISQVKIPLTFSHTLREGNQLADQLANQAMDQQ